jgi:hypothetical protein
MSTREAKRRALIQQVRSEPVSDYADVLRRRETVRMLRNNPTATRLQIEEPLERIAALKAVGTKIKVIDGTTFFRRVDKHGDVFWTETGTVTLLRQRGWARSQIAELLGEPDKLRRGFGAGKPMKLYRADRVLAAERTPHFIRTR